MGLRSSQWELRVSHPEDGGFTVFRNVGNKSLLIDLKAVKPTVV
jgi:hypothetical protein